MFVVRHAAKQLFGVERHLISSIRVRRLVESESHCYRSTFRFQPFSTSTIPHNMPSSLSINPTATIVHPQVSSPATWREALITSGLAPKSFEIIKTLVYKPKTAKTATPVPVVVIARDETEANSAALGKKLNLKELRLASEDLLTEFFSLDKDSCTPFLLTLVHIIANIP